MDKLREDFEEWASNDRSELDVWQRGHKAGEYKNPVVGKMWKAWQASRASIVVELPAKNYPADMFVSDAYDAEEVVAALRSIGLSIKGE